MVGVPIGHPDDITVRALQILAHVDLITSEDPSVTQQLLSHHDITATVTSYGPRNLQEKVAVLLNRLQQGLAIAFVCDCGSPLIADPGHLLVAAAHQHGIPVVSVPGPSVPIAALTISGFPCDSFYFFGYLPRTAAGIHRCITDALERRIPTVVFCTVTTLTQALKALDEIEPQYPVGLIQNLTTPTELIMRGTARQVRKRLHQVHRQELTLIFSGQRGKERKTRRARRIQSVSSRRIRTR